MKDLIIKNLAYIYLSFALFEFADLDVFNWRYYAVTIPFIFLDAFFNNYKNLTK